MISLENFRDFEKLLWVVASKFISTDKNIFKFGNKVTNIVSIDVILIYIFLYLTFDE